MTEVKKITKEMTIEEVVNNYPETFLVFMKHGLHCVGCHASAFENIEEGALMHGIDVNALIADLNNVISRRKTEVKAAEKAA